ncbi:TPA: ead/Ea22-like family protein [Citrobacter freundii]
MTALNKQALREAAERAASDSWGYDRDEFNDAITPEVALALLDELEAAEKRIAELEANKGKPVMFIDGDISASDAEKLAEVIREMGRRTSACITGGNGSREVAVKQFDDFQIVHYGATEDYAKGYIDCQNNYNKALAAAGIGVKGE